jgi:hypothetical protein
MVLEIDFRRLDLELSPIHLTNGLSTAPCDHLGPLTLAWLYFCRVFLSH